MIDTRVYNTHVHVVDLSIIDAHMYITHMYLHDEEACVKPTSSFNAACDVNFLPKSLEVTHLTSCRTDLMEGGDSFGNPKSSLNQLLALGP